MSKIKVETPEGTASKAEKTKKAAAGCLLTIIGLALLGLVAYLLYVFFTV